MKGVERIRAAVAFGATDRFPVVPQVFAHAGVVNGVPPGEYVRNGGTLARCQLKALERYGYDAVFAFMDVCVETEAVGSSIRYCRDGYPSVAEPVFATVPKPFPSLPDPQKAGRMPELLRAVSVLRREVKEDALVVGCVLGPLTLTTQLMGMEAALYLAADDPGEFGRMLDYATNIGCAFGASQIGEGAHLPLVFEPSASPEVIPPQVFREFVLPRLRKLFGVFTNSGAAANWLHIAGSTESILPYYPDTGADIANFDYCVDPGAAQQALPGTCLDGNLKSLSFVEDSSREITAASLTLCETFARRGGFILSSGCEIPPEAKPENVEAMVQAASASGKRGS